MRKFLSLVLALVMMMSLVTINAGAKEFTDDGDITYKEAVDVISTIKVMDGYDGGGFQPNGNLTRGAAAKIICNLILGPTTAAELHADTAPYRDVPVNHTFAGYIAYCQKEGIVSGYADGSFRPAGTLTGYAFMKMLLGALGYDAEIEGFVGPNWSINVAKKAIGIGLNRSLADTFNGVDYITREEAALYAFNTLRTDLVQYDQKITASVNGAEVTVGNSIAKAQTWNNSITRRNNIKNDDYIQFAEQYFNKLVLTEAEDCFGRPDREWKYDGDEIGAYINYDLFKEEYTTKVTGKDLYDLLGSKIVDTKDGYDFTITIDGEETKGVLGDAYFTQGNLVRTNTEKVGNTGKGVLTQVFVDNDKEVEHVWIAIINTYVAKATTDYNAKKDEVTYTVWSVNSVNSKTALVKDTDEKENLTVDGEDFDIKDVKEDDIVLVHVADNEIKEFVDPEVIDSTELVAFKKGDWIKADEQYDYADTIQYDDEVLDNYDEVNMKDTTYRVFLDEYGYAIGIEIIEAVDQYAFLTGIDSNGSHLTNKYADARLIFTDGTSETVRINMEKSKACNPSFTAADDADSDTAVYTTFSKAALWNTWCTYTVDANNVYTLTEVANTNAQMSHNDSGNAYVKTANHEAYKRGNDKLGQGRDYDMTVGAVTTSQVVAAAGDGSILRTIDKKRIGLNGVGAGFATVYGNDDSIYLTAETKFIEDADNGKPNEVNQKNVIINGVDSVTVGVQNTSLDVYDIRQVIDKTKNTSGETFYAEKTNTGTDSGKCNVANGVYTLFKDNGYVIAAVVVGEDNGTSSKYAYVTSKNGKDGLSQEEWTKSDAKWKWTREVIVDGELVELVEIGDSLASDGIENMNRNNWYEVKYKADGTVRKVTPIIRENDSHSNAKDYVFCTDRGSHLSASTYPKFAGLIQYVDAVTLTQNENSLTQHDGNVVLFEDMTKENHPEKHYKISAKGNSLMVTNDTDGESKGFAVSANAKIALVQDVKPSLSADVKIMDYVETYESGQSALKRAIDDLNDNNEDDEFDGYLSAVFEGGLATSVVIYDKDPTNVDQGTSTTGSLTVTVQNGRIRYTFSKDVNGEDIADAIKNALEKLGYENIVCTIRGNMVTKVTAEKNGYEIDFGTPTGQDKRPSGGSSGSGSGSSSAPKNEDVQIPEQSFTSSSESIKIVTTTTDEVLDEKAQAALESALEEMLTKAGYLSYKVNYQKNDKGQVIGVESVEATMVNPDTNETVTKTLTVETAVVEDDPETTIVVAEGVENVLDLAVEGNKVTVTVNKEAVKTAAEEAIDGLTEESPWDDENPLAINGFGTSPDQGTDAKGIFLICTKIVWTAPDREGVEVARCQVYDSKGKLLADTEAKKPGQAGYDPDTKTTGSVFWPHVGVFEVTRVKGEDGSWTVAEDGVKYNGSNATKTGTQKIVWTYADGVQLTQTREINFVNDTVSAG